MHRMKVNNMEREDLMIGDWVMYDPNVFIKDKKYEQNHLVYPIQIANGEDIDNAIENCYAPIPLTAKILEKNGFKQADAFRKGYGYDFPSQYIEDMYPIYLRTNGIWNIQCAELIDIKYVHELQHILRIRGLNELADNFKI